MHGKLNNGAGVIVTFQIGLVQRHAEVPGAVTVVGANAELPVIITLGIFKEIVVFIIYFQPAVLGGVKVKRQAV